MTTKIVLWTIYLAAIPLVYFISHGSWIATAIIAGVLVTTAQYETKNLVAYGRPKSAAGNCTGSSGDAIA